MNAPLASLRRVLRKAAALGTTPPWRWRQRLAPKEQIDGVPEGITFELLSEQCLAHRGAPLRRVSYTHLSGWKAHGAFRLLLVTTKGKPWRLIYKNCRYGVDDVPALAGLPVLPGRPEYLVYSNPGEELAAYLPTVYLCRQLPDGEHYQYLLEDLSGEYRRAYIQDDRLTIASQLPHIHRVLQEWYRPALSGDFLRYDESFSSSLQVYCAQTMGRFVQERGSASAKAIWSLWPQIARMHSRTEFRDMQKVAAPIHGDLNPSNALVSRRGPHRIKLVDWEWAGVGTAYADVASLLKGASPVMERQALDQLLAEMHLPWGEGRRLYLWCQLERAMLDAAFIASQIMGTLGPTTMDLQEFFEDSMRRMMRFYHELWRGSAAIRGAATDHPELKSRGL